MKQELDQMFDLLSKLTKDEADFILQVCKWSDEERAAFRLAKSIFEDNDG
jgi:hypothetical protein